MGPNCIFVNFQGSYFGTKGVFGQMTPMFLTIESQICLNLFKLVWKCLNYIKHVKVGLELSKPLQSGPNCFYSHFIKGFLAEIYSLCASEWLLIYLHPIFSQVWTMISFLSFILWKSNFQDCPHFFAICTMSAKKFVILSRLFYFYFCTLGTFGQKMARLLTGSSSTTEWLSGLEVVLSW